MKLRGLPEVKEGAYMVHRWGISLLEFCLSKSAYKTATKCLQSVSDSRPIVNRGSTVVLPNGYQTGFWFGLCFGFLSQIRAYFTCLYQVLQNVTIANGG